MGAIDARQGYQVATSECVMCLDCLADCPQDEMGLRFGLPPRPAGAETQTGALHLAAAGAGGAWRWARRACCWREIDVRAKQPDGMLVRPPGAQDEAEFLSRCLRCGLCIRTCPTTGLQPALVEAGLDGLWTPRLASRLGACDYACTACGEVCPSGAIPLLGLAEKRETVIGVASVDRNRCLPWSYDTPCIVCEEMCPRPTKAIRLEEVQVKGADGHGGAAAAALRAARPVHRLRHLREPVPAGRRSGHPGLPPGVKWKGDTNMKMREHILLAMREHIDQWEELLAAMPEEQINSPRLPSSWSVKDEIAHLWAWQQRSIARVEAALHDREPDYPVWIAGIDPGDEGNTEPVNAWIYETYRDRSWPEVHAMWREGFLRLPGIWERDCGTGPAGLGPIPLAWSVPAGFHIHSVLQSPSGAFRRINRPAEEEGWIGNLTRSRWGRWRHRFRPRF